MSQINFLPAIIVGLATIVSAQTTRNVPASYPTIQSAIDAAAPSDTVMVAPGTYHERINFSGKAILVTSSAGASGTVIDADLTGSVVRFVSGETGSSVLDGFTVTDGKGANGTVNFLTGNVPPKPGGIEILGTSPTIRNCIIIANQGGVGAFNSGQQGGAGGIGAIGGNPTIENCRIEANIAGNSGSKQGGSVASVVFPDGSGGGVTLRAAGAMIRRTAFIANTGGNCSFITSGGTSGTSQGTPGPGGAGAVHMSGNASNIVVLENCIFRGNVGGNSQTSTTPSGTPIGILPNIAGAGAVENVTSIFGGVLSTNCTIRHCTIVDNSAGTVGSAFYGATAGPVTVDNSIVRGAFSTYGFVARYSNLSQSTTGVGLSFLSPALVVDSFGIPRPTADSPAIEAADRALAMLPTVDFDGQPRITGYLPDMGAIEFSAPSRIGSSEDFVLETSINGAADRRALSKSATIGDSVDFTMSTPGLTHTDRIVFLVAQLFPNGQPPFSQPGFPELLVNQYGAAIVFDGFAANPADPIGLSATGELTINYTWPYTILGSSVRLQAVVFNPSTRNGIFATSHAVDFQML